MSKSFEIINPIERFTDEIQKYGCDNELCQEMLDIMNDGEFDKLCNTTIYYSCSHSEYPILHYLLIKRNYVATKMLIDKGLKNIECVFDGYSVLQRALEQCLYNFSKLLIENNADVNFVNHMGDTPLTIIASSPTYIGANTSKLITQLLIDQNANVNHCKGNGDTPLIIACENYHCDNNIITYLVNANANVNHCNVNGKTALFCACSIGKYKIVKFLLDSGADPNITDNNGKLAQDYIKGKKAPEIYSLIQWSKNSFKN